MISLARLPNRPGTPEIPQKYKNTALVLWRPSDTLAPCTYSLERRTEGETNWLIVATGVAECYYNATDLPAGGTFRFRVACVNKAGQGPYSNLSEKVCLDSAGPSKPPAVVVVKTVPSPKPPVVMSSVSGPAATSAVTSKPVSMVTTSQASAAQAPTPSPTPESAPPPPNALPTPKHCRWGGYTLSPSPAPSPAPATAVTTPLSANPTPTHRTITPIQISPSITPTQTKAKTTLNITVTTASSLTSPSAATPAPPTQTLALPTKSPSRPAQTAQPNQCGSSHVSDRPRLPAPFSVPPPAIGKPISSVPLYVPATTAPALAPGPSLSPRRPGDQPEPCGGRQGHALSPDPHGTPRSDALRPQDPAG
ncbi:hypothetical protein ANANG_G00282160 [Anguilla anguilla]|uniref:Fibronectin type-III domain-containing protein n=1 Tax=Anguilla anguilla TaxID=7936 RepID=A0A9D3LN34_ANGAN|nr:hypothetical protein ANANG_G00282160 [Anguilla anguilla]